MLSRAYYYLVAGLPDLSLQQSHLPFSSAEWISVLTDHLSPPELAQLRLLRLPADHQTLLGLLRGASTPEANDWALYDPEFLAEALEEESDQLPAYFLAVHAAFRQKSTPEDLLNAEHQLTESYYDYALEKATGLVQQWLPFDRDLRNLMTGWHLRKHNQSTENQLVGQNAVSEAIRESSGRDFGMGREYPSWNWWVQEAEDDGLVERQQNLERIRWHFIDEALSFSYFSADVLLGYLLKLQILQRRLEGEPQRGRQRLEHFIQEAAKQLERT